MKALEEFVHNAKILIVDDELTNVLLLEGFFEDNDQPFVVSTTDSREALEHFRRFAPDIVLLDLMMPYLDGFDVMAQLKAEMPPENQVPILVLTADNSNSATYRSLEAGASDFLTKPLDMMELGLRVRSLLERRFFQQAYIKRSQTLEQTVGEQKEELEDLGKLRKQAIYEERLHAFSQIAGGVVHDFNNCLTILQGCSELMMSGICDERMHREMLEALHTASHDASNVVDRLRHFYRPHHEDNQFQECSVGEILDKAMQLSRVRWQNQAQAKSCRIDFQADLDMEVLAVCNPSELRDSLINLIFNAIDAMPEGGSITLSNRLEGRHVVIEVSDTGHGMTDEVKEQCLDPFFSTKGSSGTGLGLATVHGIVKQHKGELNIDSEVGQGTTFRIRFPQEMSLKELEIAPRLRTELNRSIKILVAEDDHMVQRLLCSYLSREGHEVTGAKDGEEALEQFRQGDFDLLITDLSMPRMNGEQLAALIKKERFDFPVIMLTGFDKVFLPDGKMPVSVDVLRSKPISAESLCSTVAGLMA